MTDTASSSSSSADPQQRAHDGARPQEVEAASGTQVIVGGPSVTIDVPPDGEAEDAAALRHRHPFVSRHRRELNYIKEDAAESRTYSVPNASAAESGMHSWVRRPADAGRLTSLVEAWWKSDSNEKNKKRTASQWLETFFPAWAWLRTYSPKESLGGDLVAGLTVGVMIIPQSMSYAKLAGLPIEYGLYSALVPVYAYSFFGSSRQLAVGPVALISLLLSTGLGSIMEGSGLEVDSPEYIAVYTTKAIQTSFLVGVLYMFMGICRLGFVTIFLSHAVISGFTTGAAVIIGMSQVKYIFGYDVARSKRLHELLYNIFSEIQNFNWKTFLLGCCAIGALVGAKNIGKAFPKFKWVRAVGPLAVTALAIILVVAFDLQDRGIPIVGHIPKGFPALTISRWTPLEELPELMVVVISITIVGFMESIAIAKQLASKHKYEIDSSVELIGLGMSNFLGGMFNAYPVTGSFSRSAVNNESGAQSGISAMVTATMVGFTLLFLTSVFEKLPLAVLAAIVISGVLGLIDSDEAKYLWKVHPFDFLVWLVACLGTMFLGVEIGLAIAVGVSLLIVIYESAYPHTSVLGRLPGTTIYRNVKQYPEAERVDGIVSMRIDAPLYFANAQNVRDKIRKYRLNAEKSLEERSPGSTVKFLILDMSPVSHLDTSALHILEDMYINYRSRGQQLVFSNPSLLVMKRLDSSGLADKVGREHFFAACTTPSTGASTRWIARPHRCTSRCVVCLLPTGT